VYTRITARLAIWPVVGLAVASIVGAIGVSDRVGALQAVLAVLIV